MRNIYGVISLITFLVLITVGSFALLKPISVIDNPETIWIAWIILIITSSIAIRYSYFSIYLQGVNKIALLRRWETFTSLGNTLSSIAILLNNGGLLALIIVTQSWLIIGLFGIRYLCYNCTANKFGYKNNSDSQNLFKSIWPNTWKSGTGVLMGFGAFHASGVILAQLATPSQTASYLLALRFIHTISQFSQAPFYTKIPVLARNYAEGNLKILVYTAANGMRLSYWVFIFGFIIVAVFLSPLLKLIDSNVPFIAAPIWYLLGVAVFAERYGAMHLNLFSMTNKIITHIANGVSGVIFLILSYILFSKFGVLAFPIGLLISYIGFYCWYSAIHSYRAFNLNFWTFENSIVFPPLFILLVYLTIEIFFL